MEGKYYRVSVFLHSASCHTERDGIETFDGILTFFGICLIVSVLWFLCALTLIEQYYQHEDSTISKSFVAFYKVNFMMILFIIYF